MNGDLGDMVRDDLETVRGAFAGGMDLTLPAALEVAFAALTALVGLCWLVAMFWVPAVIDGPTWMGLGMLGLLMFGVPFGVIYAMRRGGAEIARAIIRDLAR